MARKSADRTPRALAAVITTISVAMIGVRLASAQQSELPVTLKVGAPEKGDTFACRIPVTVEYSEPLGLRQLDVTAKAYAGDVALASTGFRTGERVLARDPRPGGADYEPVPVQFELRESSCESMTALGVMIARCTLSDGRTIDCIDFIRFEPEEAGGVRFFVEESGLPRGR